MILELKIERDIENGLISLSIVEPIKWAGWWWFDNEKAAEKAIRRLTALHRQYKKAPWDEDRMLSGHIPMFKVIKQTLSGLGVYESKGDRARSVQVTLENIPEFGLSGVSKPTVEVRKIVI